MAGLRVKTFSVQVFVSRSLLEAGPADVCESVEAGPADVCESVEALTEVTAVGQVMRHGCLDAAGVVYIACGAQERWLYGVALVNGQLSYEHSI